MVGVEGWLDIRRVDVVRKVEDEGKGDLWHGRERENYEREEKQAGWRMQDERIFFLDLSKK